MPVPASKIDLQRRFASKSGQKVERSKIRFRNQFDHGTKVEPLRGDSTPQPTEIGFWRGTLSGLLWRTETDRQHGNAENDVKPGVGRIIGNQTEQHAIGGHKPEDGDDSVDGTKDLEPQSCGSRSRHRSE